ncbi:MAG: hypothetical protein ACP5O3_02070 [Candidatus Micrarchaeia archaeon]
MKTVAVDAKTTEEASRVEWLARLVYWIPLTIVIALSIDERVLHVYHRRAPADPARVNGLFLRGE